VPEAINVAPGVLVPAAAVRMSAARSSGPGGQNVNKVASKVELRVDPHAITGLSDRARSRLLTKTAGRRDADGWIIVVSQRTRDQHRNLEDARQKVRELIVAAFVEPKRRRKTKPSQSARERRLSEKKRQGERKLHRRRGADD
jgi:ribosome-associated protein